MNAQDWKFADRLAIIQQSFDERLFLSMAADLEFFISMRGCHSPNESNILPARTTIGLSL